jgi:D-alanine-D-alanine ligase
MKTEFDKPGVVVLYNSTEGMIKGEPKDLIAEQGVIACAETVSRALESAGYRVARLPFSGDVELGLAPFPAHEWMVFNLAEGMAGRLFEEARIAWALEAMGYAFTGSDGQAIANSLHKAKAKVMLAAKRVRTPAHWLFRHPDEVEDSQVAFGFPLIVKPIAEDASFGIDAGAIVHSTNELRERVAYVVECYRQSALAEALILGREFNVSLLGNPARVLPFAEIDFSAMDDPEQRIVSFAAKWEEDSYEYQHTPVICPASVDFKLMGRLQTAAKRAWKAIGCRGYSRVDMRVDSLGIPYVIEVNCNPDLSVDAGFYRAAQADGCTYQDMVLRILDSRRRECHVKDRSGLEQRWFSHPADSGTRRQFHHDRSFVR